jgi:hypothetical protein
VRNAKGQVIYVEPPAGHVVDLTPIAFELYAAANAVRTFGMPCRTQYSNRARDLYWEALAADFGGMKPTAENIALTFETAAELADFLGL